MIMLCKNLKDFTKKNTKKQWSIKIFIYRNKVYKTSNKCHFLFNVLFIIYLTIIILHILERQNDDNRSTMFEAIICEHEFGGTCILLLIIV